MEILNKIAWWFGIATLFLGFGFLMYEKIFKKK
jgi:hypothetical protein